MTTGTCDNNGVVMLGEAFYEYLQEIEAARQICCQHQSTAAIHERGTELQIYSIFKREERTAAELRSNTDFLPDWKQSPYYRADGRRWGHLQSRIEKQMAKHTKLHPIITRGVNWEGYPMLIHAYKFEPDPVMKIELVLPTYQSEAPPLPIKTVAAALECLDFLVPSYVTTPLPPYDHHETKFSTIFEYLRRVMPKDTYASISLSWRTLYYAEK